MKKILRIFTLSVILFMGFSNAFAENALSIYGESFSGKNGETITFPVYVDGNTGFYSYNIDLIYDPNYLTPIIGSERKGNVTAGFLVVNPNYQESGKIVKFISVHSTNYRLNGMLFSFQFEVKPGIPQNVNTQIEIRVNKLKSLIEDLVETDVSSTVRSSLILLNQGTGLPNSIHMDSKAKHYVPHKYEPFVIKKRNIDKPYFFSFAQVLKYNGYILKEYGMIFSDKPGTMQKGELDCIVVPADGGVNSRGQFGVLFYGERLKKNTHYYTRSYGVYRNESTDEETTIYGEITSVMTAAE